jgi:hypothetical protein
MRTKTVVLTVSLFAGLCLRRNQDATFDQPHTHHEQDPPVQAVMFVAAASGGYGTPRPEASSRNDGWDDLHRSDGDGSFFGFTV